MSRYYNEDTLAHFGIPGMKWGVRKDKYSSWDAKMHRKIEDYMDRTDLSTLTNKQRKNLATLYAYFEAKKQGVEVPKLSDEFARSIDRRFTSRKSTVLSYAGMVGVAGAASMIAKQYANHDLHSWKDAAGMGAVGLIAGAIAGAYAGHKIKDAQRDYDEDLPYID